MTINVLIADDQAMIRSGIRMILEDEPDITVVGEAANGVDAVSMARRLRPDVCLVDIRMPQLDGLEVTQALAGPGVPVPMQVVVVTTFDLDDYVYGALRNGAAGSLLKDAGPRLLVEAVRAASVGYWYLPVCNRTAAAPPHHRGPDPGEAQASALRA